MIETVIFDLGGVVLNRGLWCFWDYMKKEYGISNETSTKFFLSSYKDYFSGKISEEDFWKTYLKGVDLDEDWKKLRNEMLNLFKPNKGMPELLSSLKEKGYNLILLSDQTKEWWPFLNTKYDVSSYFDHCVVSYEVGVNKPDPEIYRVALKNTSSAPADCVFVDDLEKNLPPAEELGMKTILFTDVENLKNKLKELDIKF